MYNFFIFSQIITLLISSYLEMEKDKNKIIDDTTAPSTLVLTVLAMFYFLKLDKWEFSAFLFYTFLLKYYI